MSAANVSVDLLQVSVWRDESNVDQVDTNLDQFDTANSISHFNASIKFYATLLSSADTFILSQLSPLQTETWSKSNVAVKNTKHALPFVMTSYKTE